MDLNTSAFVGEFTLRGIRRSNDRIQSDIEPGAYLDEWPAEFEFNGRTYTLIEINSSFPGGREEAHYV